TGPGSAQTYISRHFFPVVIELLAAQDIIVAFRIQASPQVGQAGHEALMAAFHGELQVEHGTPAVAADEPVAHEGRDALGLFHHGAGDPFPRPARLEAEPILAPVSHQARGHEFFLHGAVVHRRDADAPAGELPGPASRCRAEIYGREAGPEPAVPLL